MSTKPETAERAELIGFLKQKSAGGHQFDCFMFEKAIALLAADGRAGGEPVAWRTFDGEGGYDYRDEYIKRNGEKYASWVVPLYTHPQPQAEAVRVPLTDEQWQVIADVLGCFITRLQKDSIEDMLAAAPKPQEPEA